VYPAITDVIFHYTIFRRGFKGVVVRGNGLCGAALFYYNGGKGLYPVCEEAGL
jgi:hypothetical protein